MAVARPLLLLLLLPLLLLAGINPSAAADCNASTFATAPMFTTTVTWFFDPRTLTCQMQDTKKFSPPTTIRMDETKTVAGIGNDCLHFGCWFNTPWIDSFKSSCFLKEGCCAKMSEVQNKPSSCLCFVGLIDNTWPIVPYSNNTRSFNISSQYVCYSNQGQWGLLPSQPGFLPLSYYHNAHWPLHPWYPYHPYYPGLYPSYPGYYAHYTGPWAPWNYPPYSYAHYWPYYQSNYTDSHNLTGGQTIPAPSGCSNNGTTVAEGAVAKTDICGKTVCQGGKLVTQVAGGGSGCAYEPLKQCIKEGSNLTIHEQTTCFVVSCLKNGSEAQPKLDTQRSGCFYEDKCYPGGSQVTEMGTCKTVSCQQDSTTGQFSLVYNLTGCFTIDGRCIDENTDEVNDCNKTTCERNSTTGGFFLNLTSEGCISLTEPHTCRFDHDESDDTANDTCIYNTCKTHPTNRWETHFKGTENCSALSTMACETEDGMAGCEHRGDCHPVKTIIDWGNCTQFVCYSEDVLLNAGNRSNARPAWEPRALGCYGPLGCMKFGEDFVDVYTNNTYRCGYNISGLGHKYPQLLLHCSMPSALPIAVGTVIREDLAYYACTREGMRILKINQTVPMPGEVKDCGRNWVTNETMYPGNRYHLNTSFCDILPNCSKTCTYFDTPCYIDDTETDAKIRALGETFTLGNAQCACTRDNEVHNHQPPNGTRANSPSLCAEDGVQGGACKDPDKPEVLRKWGEIWLRSDTKPSQICTCNPVTRKALCSVQAPEVVNLPVKAGNP